MLSRPQSRSNKKPNILLLIVSMGIIGITIGSFSSAAPKPENAVVVKGHIESYCEGDVDKYYITAHQFRKPASFHKYYTYEFEGKTYSAISEVGGMKAISDNITVYVNEKNPADSLPIVDYMNQRFIAGFISLLGLVVIANGLLPKKGIRSSVL